MKKFGLIIAFLLIFLCPPAMSEQVYTWIDENGAKHFGNVQKCLHDGKLTDIISMSK